MPEAVIVATARTPDRAGEQGIARRLPSRRPLGADHPRRCSTRCRSSTPRRSKTSSGAAASPPARPASTSRRVAAILAGIDVPGVTVNRYCSSSLQTIRMAAHAIKAGEGDVFISGGVETVSRFQLRRGRQRCARTRSSSDARARTKERTEGGQPPWTPPAGLPDVYIAMGQTAENVVEAEGVTREEMDEFAVRRSSARSKRRRTASSSGRSRRSRSPTARSSTKDDGPRAGTTVEKLATLKPVFRPDGKVTAGQRVPAQRRRRRGRRDERHQGERARHHAARPHRRQRRERAQPGDHGPRPDRGEPPGAEARRHDHRRHRPRRDQRGVRGAGHPVRQAPRHPVRRSSTCTAARSRSATRSA